MFETHYIQDRLLKVDPDFLSFEEEMISEKDQTLLTNAIENKVKLKNPYNSILLYVTGVSDEFDFNLGRSETIGGSPPDIDIDFEKLRRKDVVAKIIEKWGQENVASIGTFNTFKPRALTNSYFSINEPSIPDNEFREREAREEHWALYKEISKKIPEPLYGQEPTLTEIIEGNEEKNYAAHPELISNPKYRDWLEFARRFENMIKNQSVHAAGIVISDFPIWKEIPIWKTKDYDQITQFDMKQVEELGLIKFDLLVIANLDIINRCCKLIEEIHGITIDPNNIEDFDSKTYTLLEHGLLCGVFQMETSRSAKELITTIKPQSISELSDISALNRPGPLEAGFHTQYIQNKLNGYPPQDMHPEIARLTKDSYWTIVYQETVMAIVSEIAGFNLQRTDDIRRAMGKKAFEAINQEKIPFVDGCVSKGMSRDYAERLWEDLAGFSAYGFNKSHSISYSYITYACAYLKANYPVEFFCALMSIRSETMQPKDWAAKAPEYISEARQLNVIIHGPNIQTSKIGFTITDNEVSFGFNAIKSVGVKAARELIRARGSKQYEDIYDFVSRVNLSIVNIRTFESLVKAGCFDKMGYIRAELLEKARELYDYFPAYEAYTQRKIDIVERDKENEIRKINKDEKEAKFKEAKVVARQCKKSNEDIPDHISYILEEPDRQRTYREIAKDFKDNFDKEGLSEEEIEDALKAAFPSIEEYKEYKAQLNLRKLPTLKPLDKPEKPTFTRKEVLTLTISELIEQSEYIGCFIENHPARIAYPEADKLSLLEKHDYVTVAVYVVVTREFRTRTGKDMMVFKGSDGTGIAEFVVFSNTYENLKLSETIPQEGDIILLDGECRNTDPTIEIVAKSIEIFRSQDELQVETAGRASS